MRPAHQEQVLDFTLGPRRSPPRSSSLDNTFAHPRFRVTDAVVVAPQSIVSWRTAFAERTLEQWAQHREDLPAAFGQLETDLKIQVDSHGFLRVEQSRANRERLATWAAAKDEASH